MKAFEQAMASMLKVFGTMVTVLMLVWLWSSPITPNFAQGRIILGLVMVGLGYIIDIKRILESRL